MATATTTVKGRPVVPELTDHPEYQRLSARVAQLQAEETAARRRLAAIDASLPALLDGPGVRARQEAAALALLEGVAVEDLGPARLRAERDRLHSRRQEITRALALADGRLHTLRQQASRPVCEALAPRLTELKRRQLELAAELARAVQAERQFWERIAERDVIRQQPLTEPLLLLRGPLDLTEYNSLLHQVLRDAVEDGTLSRKEAATLAPRAFDPQAPLSAR